MLALIFQQFLEFEDREYYDLILPTPLGIKALV